MKNIKDFAFAILMIVVGILLIVMKSGAVSLAVTILGAALIVAGVLDILVNKKDLIVGIVEIVIGVLLIVFAWALAGIVLFIVAAVLVIYGIYSGYLVLKRGIKDVGKLLLALIVPILYVVAGIFLFLNGFGWAFIIAGVILVVYGILAVIDAVVKNKK